jgi:hypothetical protein
MTEDEELMYDAGLMEGRDKERERIINLLKETFGTLGIEMRTGGYVFATDLETLIKGQNK